MIDLHGRHVLRSRTLLSETAVPGSSQIHLQSSVSNAWRTGDRIVLGATGFLGKECETLEISSISQDGLTVNLTSPVVYKHIGLYNS